MGKGVYSRRFFLGGIASGVATGLSAETPLRLPRPVPRPRGAVAPAQDAAASLIEKAGLSGKIGFVVADAKSGKVLETHNPLLPLPPASVTKAISALYALDALGMEHRFHTRLIATGPVQGGEIQGDLILAGGGDPMLDTDALAEMAARLNARGVRAVKGRFRIYAGAIDYQRMIDPDQPDHVSYNPAVSGLNLNFNRVYFEWKRNGADYSVSMDARATKFRPEVAVANMRIVARDLPVYTYKSDTNGHDQWTVANAALGRGGGRWLPVRRPDLYAADVFRTLARTQGIILPPADEARTVPSGTVLVDRDSASLTSITRLMLKYSTNLTAEVIGLSATAARGATATSLKSSAREMSDWMQKSLGARRVKFVDHSGLGDASRVSASDMVRALVRARPEGPLHGLMKEIVPHGSDGKPDRSVRHKIRAKTGTLNFVSALAGYITTAEGRQLAFAIFSADTARRDRLSRSDREAPEGARPWTRRARILQHELINRWAASYGA